MYPRHLIIVALSIILAGCTPSNTENTDSDPNTTPEGIRITPDVVYGHKFGMALTFDMFQPQNQNGAGVIFINDGGYISPRFNFYKQTNAGLRLPTVEDLEKMHPAGRAANIKLFLDKGFTFFDVRHGSSPKFEMREIVADLRRAVRFIRFNAGEYGVDAERLGLWGGSTGGHLALLLGTTADIGNTEVTDEFEKETGRVAAVVVFFTSADLEKVVDLIRKSNPNAFKQIPVLDLGDDEAREFSPINFFTSDDPPTLIVHGEKDQAVPINEGESMYQALEKAGIDTKFIKIPGVGHNFAGENQNKARDQALAETK
ncbi:MAG: alpha/beta hydrolase, partial [Acidobacteriota bacterium]